MPNNKSGLALIIISVLIVVLTPSIYAKEQTDKMIDFAQKIALVGATLLNPNSTL